MRSVKQILMDRDNNTEREADERIEHFKEDLDYYVCNGDYDGAADTVADHFGLEPDYLDDFLI